MNCQRCGYSLFQLTRSDCPECGRPFAVTDYRFERGAVEFACAQCGQTYQGNDDRGLPFPRVFDCVGCRAPADAARMVVRPVAPDARGHIGSPWDDRRPLGLWRAWWETTKMTLFRAPTFFREHVGQSTGEAYWFAVMSTYVGWVPYMLLVSGMIVLIVGVGSGYGGGGPGMGVSLGIGAALLAAAAIGPLIGPFFYGGFLAVCTHLALVALAPQRKSFGHTFRTMLYSHGPMTLVAIPVCGSYAYSVWILVTAILGVKEVHQTSGWVAAAAVLWPVVCLLGLYVAILFAVLGFGVGS